MHPGATKSKKLFLAQRSQWMSLCHWPWCHWKGHHQLSMDVKYEVFMSYLSNVIAKVSWQEKWQKQYAPDLSVGSIIRVFRRQRRSRKRVKTPHRDHFKYPSSVWPSVRLSVHLHVFYWIMVFPWLKCCYQEYTFVYSYHEYNFVTNYTILLSRKQCNFVYRYRIQLCNQKYIFLSLVYLLILKTDNHYFSRFFTTTYS